MADKNLSDPFNAARFGQELLTVLARPDADETRVLALIAKGASLREKTEEGCTALILAAFHGHGRIAEALIKAGAPLDDITCDHYDFIPHMHSRTTDMNDFAGHVDALERISVSRATALGTAIVRAHLDIVVLLLAANAKLDGALSFARQGARADIRKLVEDKCAGATPPPPKP